MKSFDSRTYSLNDFVEWEKKRNNLVLNPKFQRRSVWTDKAKSFLMDTIIRGKPIPKFFIRQSINVSTKSTVREVVDGQQRLRTILAFIKDGFSISKRHNADYGGLLFSELPEDVQTQILSYEVSVDLLINMPDSEVLDIFSRLNSYAVVLNEQEKINADHFGPFKTLCDRVGHKYSDYWVEQGILSSKQIVRMQEVNLVADILIAMLEGIKSKKQIKKYYDKYEPEGAFPHDVAKLEKRFDSVIGMIAELYPEGLKDTEFRRPHIFYSLFTACAHHLFGIPGMAPVPHRRSISARTGAVRNSLDAVEEIFAAKDVAKLKKREQRFLEDSRRATTDEAVRLRRTEFLSGLME